MKCGHKVCRNECLSTDSDIAARLVKISVTLCSERLVHTTRQNGSDITATLRRLTFATKTEVARTLDLVQRIQKRLSNDGNGRSLWLTHFV